MKKSICGFVYENCLRKGCPDKLSKLDFLPDPGAPAKVPPRPEETAPSQDLSYTQGGAAWFPTGSKNVRTGRHNETPKKPGGGNRNIANAFTFSCQSRSYPGSCSGRILFNSPKGSQVTETLGLTKRCALSRAETFKPSPGPALRGHPGGHGGGRAAGWAAPLPGPHPRRVGLGFPWDSCESCSL